MSLKSRFLLFIILLSFNPLKNMKENILYTPPQHVQLSEKIINETGNILSKKYNMGILGTGGGLMKQVNMLALSFTIKGPLEKIQLRKIIVDCVETFLTQINENKEIRPFLKNYPFTYKEINIKLFVQNDKGLEILDPNITVCSVYEGIVYFKTMQKDNPMKYKSKESEPYPESLRIVQQSS